MDTSWHDRGIAHSVETHHDPDDTWSLWVDGKQVMSQESYGVVCAVEYALIDNPHDLSEAGEVADRVRACR